MWRCGITFSVRAVVLALALVAYSPVDARTDKTAASSPTGSAALERILSYIHGDWDQLTRSMNRCDSVVDPKLSEPAVLYLPADFPEPESLKKMAASCKIRV